jgi:hypothetical protein
VNVFDRDKTGRHHLCDVRQNALDPIRSVHPRDDHGQVHRKFQQGGSLDSAIRTEPRKAALDGSSSAALSSEKFEDRHVGGVVMPLVGLADEDRYSFSLSVHKTIRMLEKNPYFKSVEVGVINSPLRMV